MAYTLRNRHRHQKHQCLYAAVPSTTVELAWAAGFLEGEGNFGVNNRKLVSVRTGKRIKSEVVRATQKNLEPLYRLCRILGGSVKPCRNDGFGEWRTYGGRARGIMLTLYSFLSAAKRMQIREALGG